MSDYSQPDFYRFNEDSTFLIKFVKDHVKIANSILDLGAGSGILGIELANHFKVPKLTLVELQKDFMPFLESNAKSFLNSATTPNIVNQSFGEFQTPEQYDLVISNPPYYLRGQGEESKDSRRGIARSFQHEGWPELISCITRSIKPDGKAFLIIKNHPQIRKECEKHIKKLEHIVHTINNVLILELSGLNKD